MVLLTWYSLLRLFGKNVSSSGERLGDSAPPKDAPPYSYPLSIFLWHPLRRLYFLLSGMWKAAKEQQLDNWIPYYSCYRRTLSFNYFNFTAMVTITNYTSRDVRFPVYRHGTVPTRPISSWQHQTSLDKTGSDAMNAACNYSTAYCILETDSEYSGHGMVCPWSQIFKSCRGWWVCIIDFHYRSR